MNDALERLLEAHVQHELAQVRDGGLDALIAQHVSDTLRWLSDVPLRAISDPERIMGVIDRYVIDLKVSGGITELVGEMARLVFASPALARVRIDGLLSLEAYEEFAEKLLGLDGVRRELISVVAHSKALGAIVAELLAKGIVEFIFRRPDRGVVARIPGLQELAARFGRGVVPELEQRLAEWLTLTVEKQHAMHAGEAERQMLDVLDRERLRMLADEVWDALAPQELATVFAVMGEQDLEDFVVLCHEFWLKLRKAPYFRAVLAEAVSYFFEKYNDGSVASLIDDMGVSEAMIREELSAQLTPILAQAEATGFLERQLRAHLRAFYASSAAAAALAESP